MITLHRLNGSEFSLNDLHIETMEETPDTVITLTNERKYIVKEKIIEVNDMIIAYHRKIYEKRSG